MTLKSPGCVPKKWGAASMSVCDWKIPLVSYTQKLPMGCPVATRVANSPFRKLPNSIAAADQARLREAARAAIKGRVIPAYGSLLAFFRNEYVPKARTTLGASQMPGGAEYYRQQIREYTTLDLSPDEIHAIGEQEVARIQAQIRRPDNARQADAARDHRRMAAPRARHIRFVAPFRAHSCDCAHGRMDLRRALAH